MITVRERVEGRGLRPVCVKAPPICKDLVLLQLRNGLRDGEVTVARLPAAFAYAGGGGWRGGHPPEDGGGGDGGGDGEDDDSDDDLDDCGDGYDDIIEEFDVLAGPDEHPVSVLAELGRRTKLDDGASPPIILLTNTPREA